MRTKRVWSWLLIAAIAAVTWVAGGGTVQAKCAGSNKVHNSHCESRSNRLVPRGICGTCSCAAPKTKNQKRTKGTAQVNVPPDGELPWAASSAAESAHNKLKRGDDDAGGRMGGPPNDDCADAIAITEGDTPFSNVGAGRDGPDLPQECEESHGLILGKDIWYDYTPSASGIVTVSTCDSDYDVRIAAYENCDCPVTNARLVACDDDFCGFALPSQMEFSVVAGNCYKLRIGGFGVNEHGSGSIVISSEAQTVPNPLWSYPPDCAIDARQPSDFDCDELFGWDAIDIAFDGDVSSVLAAHFTVTVDPPGVTPPSIVNVVHGGNTATLELDGGIPPGHWTTFTYTPSDPNWSTKIGYVPADVSGDGTSGPLDILAIIDFLNEVGPALDIWQTDMDRSGESNSADILTVIDLLNGAGCFDSWNGQTLPGDCP